MLRQAFHLYGDEKTQVPYHLHFGKEMLDKMVQYGDHPALVNADDDETLTYFELAQKTVDIALSLARIGVRKGDIVSICSEKRMEVIPTILGIICAGAVYSPTEIKPLLHRTRIVKPKVMFISAEAFGLHKQLLDSVGCIEKYIVYDNAKQDGLKIQDGARIKYGDEQNKDAIYFKDFLTDTADVADFVPTPVNGWKDWVFVLFSSGTTGLPKGVPWTHLGFLLNSFCFLHDSHIKSSILITREWFMSYGLMVTLGSLRKGLTCVFSINNKEEDQLRAIEKYKLKIILSVPTDINQMIKSAILDQYDVTSVKVLLSASMPVMKDQVEAIKMRLPNLRGVYQIYGTTEAGSACNEMYAPCGPRAGSCGTPTHGFVLKVVDFDTRQALGPYKRGEICFKSPCLTPGYIGLDNRAFLDSEGFYKTGDVGYYDDDKYFYVVDRIKDLIKCRDVSIIPAELEAVLCGFPQVSDACVADVGGAVAALVVLTPGANITVTQLEDYFHSKMPARMRLEGGVHLVSAIPRGAGAKLDRREAAIILQDIINNKKMSIK